MTTGLTETTRTILKAPVRKLDEYKPYVTGDYEWRGRPRQNIFDLRGCWRPHFERMEVWADKDANCKSAFYLANSESFKDDGTLDGIAHGAMFSDVQVFGTDGGIDAAYSVWGPKNADFMVWQRSTASNCRIGWKIEGANSYGNKLYACGAGFCEVGIGADKTTGSFELFGFDASAVGTVLKIPTPSRPSTWTGGDCEQCGLLFDVGRGGAMYLTIRDVGLPNPTGKVVGRFGCSLGLVLENVAVPDGTVIEVFDPAGVKVTNCNAKIVTGAW